MLICILSSRPAAADFFTQTLRESGVAEVMVATSVLSLIDLLASHPVCGIAVDVPSLVRASAQGKQLISDVSEIYPLVRLNWAPGKEVTAMGNRFLATRKASVQEFVRACRLFSPRTMRRHGRVAKVMNLRWQVVSGMAGEWARGFTMDVSPGGCFVCTFDPPPIGAIVRLEYLENENSPPADGRVTWNVQWGEMLRPPGFGCSFAEGEYLGE
jgi:hypothetical protein